MSDARGGRDRPPTGDPETLAVEEFRIAADVEATVDGDALSVRTVDGRVEVTADGFGALRQVRSLRDVLPAAAVDALDRLPVDRVPLGVRVAGVEVARIDPGVPPGPLSRALGVAPASVDLRGVVRALVRERRER
ncbi:hypothetical protein [Halobaculum marinum]|uniref:Uncharacterized protein n=1 Tax=Halobaculum marinum TaxID=3031996 RepID=A0ABD5WS11_9EURY|nr:hypothetical protein [Halobaculum sp. DT55]